MRYSKTWTWIMVAILAATAAAQSNIDPAHKFAWGENIGWTNWRDANGTADGVVVGSNFLSNYIWCENVGWCNVGDGSGPYGNNDDTDFGVNILSGNDLEGFAWCENVGWVNFGWGAPTDETGRAQFDTVAGRFRGYAWAENAGWINLDDDTHFVAVDIGGLPCVDDGDCDDGDECTADTCDPGKPETGGGECVHTYRQRPYGDITPFGSIVPPCTTEDRAAMGDGFANMLDVFCAFNAFNESSPYTQCPCADVAPCGGDSFVNMFDVFAIFNAFNSNPACPDPCP